MDLANIFKYFPVGEAKCVTVSSEPGIVVHDSNLKLQK